MRLQQEEEEEENMDKIYRKFVCVIMLPKSGISVKDLAHSLFLTCVVL